MTLHVCVYQNRLEVTCYMRPPNALVEKLLGHILPNLVSELDDDVADPKVVLRCVVPFSSCSIGQAHKVIRDTVTCLRDLGLKPEVFYFG